MLTHESVNNVLLMMRNISPCPECRKKNTCMVGEYNGKWQLSCNKCGYKVDDEFVTVAVLKWNQGDKQ
jgi:ribosomal protein L37AE/L43A